MNVRVQGHMARSPRLGGREEELGGQGAQDQLWRTVTMSANLIYKKKVLGSGRRHSFVVGLVVFSGRSVKHLVAASASRTGVTRSLRAQACL